jgi:hypothetical protein
MNELDLISRFRESEALPDAAARERSRASLIGAIAASTAQLDGATRSMPPGDSRRSARGRAARGGLRRRATVAVAAAVVLALIVPLILPGGAPTASATLLGLAKVAGRGPGWETPTAGQYIYTRVIARSPSCDASGCRLVDVHRESWVARDGSGRVVETRDGERTDHTFGPGGLEFDDLHQLLGLDQGEIRRFLLQRIDTQAGSQDFALFVEIGRLLGETQALPEARISLLRLAASLPDTQDLGATPDHSGRVGIGIGSTSDGVQHQIVFDRDTALVLGEQTVSVDGGSAPTIGPSDEAPPGSWTVYSDSGLVESLDQTKPDPPG